MRCFSIQQNKIEMGIDITWDGVNSMGIKIGTDHIVEFSGFLQNYIIEKQKDKVKRVSFQKNQNKYYLIKETDPDHERVLILIREELSSLNNINLLVKVKKDLISPCPDRLIAINVIGANRCPKCNTDLGFTIDDYHGSCRYLHPDKGEIYDYKNNNSAFLSSNKYIEITRGVREIDNGNDSSTIYEWLGIIYINKTYEFHINGSSDILYFHWNGEELDFWRKPKEIPITSQVTNQINYELIPETKKSISLTEEQLIVVNQNYGPSLVFAVAGSGKSTCLVYRIERLVREGIFYPEKILASSFNRLAVEDLRSKLRQWSYCEPVDVRTLHSLGYSILKEAHIQKNIPLSYGYEDPEALKKKIVFEAIKIAREKNVCYVEELDNLDIDDFLSYVEKCKTNIAYADLDEANLPNQGLQQATQAKAPEELRWYLSFYQLYEEVRKDRNWITFDDMLLEGWESLIRYPEILNYFRQKYSCVLIDEFQDINKVQYLMLDLLISKHGNYMAIGDDDQTIYQWRGADPKYILDFEKQYQAKKYTLSLNFRSTATQVLLANEVIRHNQMRYKKTLNLYRTEKGISQIIQTQDPQSMVNEITHLLQQIFMEGLPSKDIVILVRLYAQTPIIESTFIKNGIDYQIVGNVPFYQRNEIRLFLDYLRIGLRELYLSEKRSIEIESTLKVWMNVYYQPTRYIRSKLARKIFELVRQKRVTFSQALKYYARFAGYSQKKILDLADNFEWLATNVLDTKPSKLLQELDQRIKISQYLTRKISIPELKEETNAGIRNFIEYCDSFKNVIELLDHIESLITSHDSQKNDRHKITIMSIHQAKGKEWEYVIIPQVNHGIIPFIGNKNLEEERRLFYVAITRAKKFLNIYTLNTRETSQFLLETKAEKLLQSFYQVEKILSSDIQQLSFNDLYMLLTNPKITLFKKILTPWWNLLPTDWENLFNRLKKLLVFLERYSLFSNNSISKIKQNLWFDVPQDEKIPIEIDINEFPGIEKHISPEYIKKIKDSFLSDEWPPKKRVIHKSFGEGEVVITYKERTGNCYIDIDFPTHGQKTFQYPPPKGLFKVAIN